MIDCPNERRHRQHAGKVYSLLSRSRRRRVERNHATDEHGIDRTSIVFFLPTQSATIIRDCRTRLKRKFSRRNGELGESMQAGSGVDFQMDRESSSEIKHFPTSEVEGIRSSRAPSKIEVSIAAQVIFRRLQRARIRQSCRLQYRKRSPRRYNNSGEKENKKVGRV